jgi:Tfp pilus assembly protein PilN
MPQQINLCSTALIKPRQQFEANTMLLALGVFIVLGAVLCTAWVWNLQNARQGFAATLQNQAAEMKMLQTAIAESKARAQPVSADLLQQAQGMKAEIQRKTLALQALQEGQFRPGLGHSDRLALVARSIPDAVWITAVRADAGRMEVSGFTLEPSSLNEWVVRLGQSPLMKGLRLSTVKIQSTASADADGTVIAGAAAGTAANRGRESWSFNLVSAEPSAPAQGGQP